MRRTVRRTTRHTQGRTTWRTTRRRVPLGWLPSCLAATAPVRILSGGVPVQLRIRGWDREGGGGGVFTLQDRVTWYDRITWTDF